MAPAVAIAAEPAGEAAEEEYDQDNDEYRSKRHGTLRKGPRGVPKTLPQPGSKHISGRESLVDPPKRVGVNLQVVIPRWSEGPDLRCAIAHRGISRFRVRIFDAPRNDDYVVTSLSRRSGAPSTASHRARREGSPWRSGRSCAAAPARDRRRRICAPRIATRSSSPWRPAFLQYRGRSCLPPAPVRPRKCRLRSRP